MFRMVLLKDSDPRQVLAKMESCSPSYSGELLQAGVEEAYW